MDYSNEPREWMQLTGNPLRMHYLLRYYCGYVESLIDTLCDPSMFQFTGVLLTILSPDQIITTNPLFETIKDIFDYSIILEPMYFDIYEDDYPEIPYTLRNLRHINYPLWTYALIHHTIKWNMLNDADKGYIVKWLNRLSFFDIIRYIRDNPYQESVKLLIERFTDSLDRNFGVLSLTNVKMSITDLPRERSPEDRHAITVTPLYDGPCGGLGCYFQACESRLKDPNNLDQFIENMFEPVVDSTADIIIVNIDRLAKGSKDTTIDRIVKRLLTYDHKKKLKTQPTILTESAARIHIIVPETHVNAGVGRNITFNVIRRVFADKNLLWYGMDDDDFVDSEKLSNVRRYIRAYNIPVSKIVTVNKGITTNWRNHMDRAFLHHYAQWCYLFSPVYYYFISYPCCPLEKEDRRFAEASGLQAMPDLDVFNRLAQYKENFVIATDKELYPYEYTGTNSGRPPHLELYNTKDVIRYMNVHNNAESVNEVNIAPATSKDTERHNKKFYVNSAPSYYEYTESDNETNKTLYGLSIHNDTDTRKDNPETPSLSELLERNPGEYINENFDGDLKLIRYTLYTKLYNPMYGVSLQNGKSPYDISLDSVSTDSKLYTNYRTVADDIFMTIGKNIDFNLYNRRTFIKDSDINKINNSKVLNPQSVNATIPLRTFGGRSVSRWLWIILLITSIVAIILIICPLIANVKCNSPIRKDI